MTTRQTHAKGRVATELSAVGDTKVDGHVLAHAGLPNVGRTVTSSSTVLSRHVAIRVTSELGPQVAQLHAEAGSDASSIACVRLDPRVVHALSSEQRSVLLAGLKACRWLHAFHGPRNALNSLGTAFVKVLGAWESLTTLDLSGNALGAYNGERVCSALSSCEQLTALDMSRAFTRGRGTACVCAGAVHTPVGNLLRG